MFSTTHVCMWEQDHKEGWVPKNWCFQTVVLEDSWKSIGQQRDQSILKEISPEYSLEGLMPMLTFQYFGHLMQRADSLGQTSDAGENLGQEENGATEDEMIGWHHWLNGHVFEQTLGHSEGQGNLVHCNSWGCKELDTTEQLNNNKIIILVMRPRSAVLRLKKCWLTGYYRTFF